MPGYQQELEDFIDDNRIDFDAAEALRSCPPSVAEKVFSKGRITGKNPSQVLMDRIEAAERGSSDGPQRGGGRSDRKRSASVDEVEDFLARNKVDDRACEDFRNCPPEVQAKVFARGDLLGVRNPSASLLARVRDARNSLASSGTGPSDAEIDRFIRDNNIDDRAAGDLRGCSGELQTIVLEKGDLANARNPSAAVLARIRDARKVVESGPPSGGHGGNRGWGPSPSEIDRFINDNGIDDRAASDLRACDPVVVARVFEKGDLKSARNPSAALLARMRDARKAVEMEARSGAGGFGGGPPPPAWGAPMPGYPPVHGDPYGGGGGYGPSPMLGRDVDDFVRRNDIDERAADDLRREAPEVQERVLQRGDIPRDARNPSSFLIVRIKESRKDVERSFREVDYGMQMQRPPPNYGPPIPTQRELDDFLVANRIDERAAADLFHCPPDVQVRVLARGDLGEARNPSSMLISRIKDARQDAERGAPLPPLPFSGAMMPPPMDHYHGGYRDARPMISQRDVEMFIRDNNVDERAGGDLLACPPEVQERVLARGDLREARNPSSMLISRIKDARKDAERDAHAGGGYMMDPYHGGYRDERPMIIDPREVEQFIRDNNLDERAGDDLRGCPPEVQVRVIDRGSLTHARNPNAMLISRIKESRMDLERDGYAGGAPAIPTQRGHRGPPPSITQAEVEDFIRENGVDEKAGGDLLGCPPEVQARVLARGDMRNARNPNAMLISRIKECRKAAEKDGFDGGAPGGGIDRSELPAHSEEDVEDFIRDNDFDERAGNDFRQCPPEVQARVMSRGSMRDARNPSAMLLSRIRDARKDAERDGYDGGDRPPRISERDLEDYIRDNDLDERAGNELRACNPEVQAKVMHRGDLRDARNPSAMVLSRIRDAKKDASSLGKRPRDNYAQPSARDAFARGRQAPSAAPRGGTSRPSSARASSGGSRQGNTGGSDRQAYLTAPAASYLQLPEDCDFVVDGMPVEGPAIDYDQDKAAFNSADKMLAILLDDPTGDIDIKDDPDGQQFHEIDEAIRAQGNDGKPFAVAMSAAKGKWAVGFGERWLDREKAAKLALTLALEEDAERFNLAKQFPEYRAMQELAAGDASNEPHKSQGDSGADVPRVFSLELPDDSDLVQDGLPSEGSAIVYDQALATLFGKGHGILEDIVGDLNSVKIRDDPDWKLYPDVAEALGIAGVDGSYCMAISSGFRLWAVGVGDDKHARESAAKLALSTMLAADSEKRDELFSTHPDFGALCAAAKGNEGPAAKRHKSG